MRDYQTAKYWVDKQADTMISPQGFAHLLCGEVTRYPDVPAKNPSGCWALDGAVRWQSLTSATVSYRNPERGWQSRLLLKRKGLFDWQAVSIELPIEAMLDQFKQHYRANG